MVRWTVSHNTAPPIHLLSSLRPGKECGRPSLCPPIYTLASPRSCCRFLGCFAIRLNTLMRLNLDKGITRCMTSCDDVNALYQASHFMVEKTGSRVGSRAVTAGQTSALPVDFVVPRPAWQPRLF
ncbi:hypothetical protein E2C01_015991 [Portunus trituberculatus]|uniref:Uncharacterized protein n=1 Tax=Portunus trituberculatus TaxID=210409 RepID=A0A5B7DPF2_PORTR|nr:hypothetical protein [Portunus trituberculatus]